MQDYIQTILGGLASSPNFSKKGQIQGALAIDPDMPAGDSDKRPSGAIRPVQMAKISGTAVTGAPLWMISNPEDTNCLVYASDGKIHVVNSSLAMGTALNSGNALTAASGNGMDYLKGVYLIAKNTAISHYDIGTGTLTQDWWNGVASLAALVDTTYPSINGVEIPNHMIKRHVDSQVNAYVCNVLSTGKGSLNRIVLADNGTNNGSEANVLDFPFQWYPVALESFRSYLLISLIEGVSTAVHQKPAKLAIWDCSSDSYDEVSLNFNDPLITALKRLADGSVLIFSGYATGGCRVSRMLSIDSVQQIAYIPDAYPPFQGAVDSYFDRVVFGSNMVDFSAAGVVYSLGSSQPDFGSSMGLHVPLKATASGANPQVTALKYFNQSASKPQPLIGWKDADGAGIDKLDTTVNTAIVVKFISDDDSTTETIATINNTDNPGERSVELYPGGCMGEHSFCLQFEYSNGAKLKTDKVTIGSPFQLDYLRIPLNQAIGATFVGTIKFPVKYKVSITQD